MEEIEKTLFYKCFTCATLTKNLLKENEFLSCLNCGEAIFEKIPHEFHTPQKKDF
jgi:DNA-directed RNA polymerase subunit RPC12/RpoP